MELLTPTGSETQCPYKGKARYWSVTVGDTVVAFYNERADIWVDGERQPKPDTPWARPPAR